MSNKRTLFDPDWLKSDDFKPWLSQVDDINSARCIKCSKTFNLSNMGITALRSHMNGKKHKRIMETVKTTLAMDLFAHSKPLNEQNVAPAIPVSKPESGSTLLLSNVPTASTSVSTPTSEENKNRGLNSYLIKDDVTSAEILWTVEGVMGHASSRLSGQNSKLFSRMFPDSKIAAKIKLQRDKVSYYIVYGLAPYFKNLLIEEVSNCDFYTIGFDESLNKVTQRQQMDLNIRYWPMESNEVKTRYLTSVFLGRSTASHLLEAFSEGISLLDKKRILEISMDGPNVNFKFLKELKMCLKKDEGDPDVLEMGSCGLHTMHCAFKNGIQKTGWKIIAFLKSLYNLFKDVPARRQIYSECTGSDLFPKKFCSVRWLNNGDVANRALQMMPHILKYVKEMNKSPQLSPKNENFQSILSAVKDPLLRVQLTFFKSLAEEVEPFLTEFQTDAPFAPFLYSTISGVMKDIMERIVKPDVLKKASSVQDVDMKNTSNLLTAAGINLGIATTVALKNVKSVKDIDILHFRNQCRTCLQEVIIKLQERSPLKYRLTKYVTCFDPQIASNQVVASKRLQSLLTLLVEKGRLNSSSADAAAREFKRICALPAVQESLKSFSNKDQRIDQFWYQIFQDCKSSNNILLVLKIVATLSHGNANVERGFSINKECIVENMREETIIARRTIYDAVTILGGVENLKICKSMILAVRNAHGRYTEAIEKRRKEQKNEESALAKKRKAALEIREIEAKKSKMSKEYQSEVDVLNERIHLLKNQ